MAGSVRYDKRSLTSMVNRLRADQQKELHIGIMDSQYGPENDNLTVAAVAYWNERGLIPNAPARPFMEPTFDSQEFREAAVAGLSDIVKNLMLEGGRRVPSLRNALGKKLQRLLKKAVIEFSSPANSPSWAAFKGNNDPLIHTRKMLKSINYRVRTKNA